LIQILFENFPIPNCYLKIIPFRSAARRDDVVASGEQREPLETGNEREKINARRTVRDINWVIVWMIVLYRPIRG
jgi:hypothetical protein